LSSTVAPAASLATAVDHVDGPLASSCTLDGVEVTFALTKA